MQIKEKFLFVNNVFFTYIKQRLNVSLFLSLTIYLIAFGNLKILRSIDLFIYIPFIFNYLTTLRLYDDLMQHEFDKEKPNRNYTDITTRKSLSYYLVILFIITALSSFFISPLIGIISLSFLILNHLLYLLLLKVHKINTILPLLKYPFIVYLLYLSEDPAILVNSEVITLTAVILTAFITFECMQDDKFIIKGKFALTIQSLSFLFLLINWHETKLLIATITALMISGVLNLIKMKGYPYIFMVLLLLTKLYITND